MVACFRKVLELDPNNAGGHYHLAVALNAMGEKEAARLSLARATSLGYSPEPDLVKALENGGDVLTEEIDPKSEP